MSDSSILSEDGNSRFLTHYPTSKSDKKWDVYRSSAQEIANIFYSGEKCHRKHSVRMQMCSGYLHFSWSDDDGFRRLKLKQARFCHVRSCPVCQWRRSLMWQSKIFSVLPRIAERFPTHRWLMLTLTVKNCPVNELRDTIKAMQVAFSRLRKRKEWPARGYLKSLEVTRGKDGSAHPHFHVLLLVSSSYFGHKNLYVRKHRWAEIWMDCLRIDYFPVVDVRIIKSKNPRDPHDVSAAVVEVVKYETKVSDLQDHPDFLLEMSKQLFKVRSVEVGGLIKDFLRSVSENNLKNERENPDEVDTDENKSSISFSWDGQIRKYVKYK